MKFILENIKNIDYTFRTSFLESKNHSKYQFIRIYEDTLYVMKMCLVLIITGFIINIYLIFMKEDMNEEVFYFSVGLWSFAILILFMSYLKFWKRLNRVNIDPSKKIWDYIKNKIKELNILSDSTKIIWRTGYRLLWIEIVEID